LQLSTPAKINYGRKQTQSEPGNHLNFSGSYVCRCSGLIHGNLNIVQGNRHGFKTVVATEALLLLLIRTTRGMKGLTDVDGCGGLAAMFGSV